VAQMAFPYRRILVPVEFDETSSPAIEAAARLAAASEATLFVLHVVPMVLEPTGMPNYAEVFKDQEKIAREKLETILEHQAPDAKYELMTRMGDPAHEILTAERNLKADLIVLATHGRKGVKRVLLGSVAEAVLREASCPVMTVRRTDADTHLVSYWMTPQPTVAQPGEKLSTAHTKMRAGNFRSMPVLSDGKLVGIITDRDLRRHEGYLEHTDVRLAMSEDVSTVSPTTPIRAAAQTLLERKIGALPVMEDGQLVGIISTTDVLRAFLEAV
jgi:nucleotide-binding universal stress UspA family protein/predicted transcriptional regulator